MGELELFSVIYDFLQTLTPEGFENCNKFIAYCLVIYLFCMLLKLFFNLFKWGK